MHKENGHNYLTICVFYLTSLQVDGNRRSWRSGAKVEKRLMRQWFLKTTHYFKVRDLMALVRVLLRFEWSGNYVNMKIVFAT